MKFSKWLLQKEMAVQHHFDFADDDIPTTGDRDSGGFKHMTRPGFRKGDRMMVIRDSHKVEDYMNGSTEHFGIHWIIGYVEPDSKAKEQDKESWAQYSARGKQLGQDWLQNFQGDKTIMPPPSPENTIVYIKPTSRLHPLTAWQQMHNVAHAVWNFNQPQRKQFAERIRTAIKDLHQTVYSNDPEPPTENEITVVLARLLDNQMLQRALSIEDIENSIKVSNSGWNSFDEVMYDVLTSFFRNKGKIPLRPRGPGKVYGKDRTGDMEPNQQVVQHKNVRDYVWKKLLDNQAAWDDVSKDLNGICIDAIRQCVWAKQNGPIYPYRKLQTLP